MWVKKGIILVVLFYSSFVFAQIPDSSSAANTKIILGSKDNLQQNNAHNLSSIDSLLHPELRIGGYVSTYYAYYDDEIENNNFVQFPTLAPRNKQFSLNMALISLAYQNPNLRGDIVLHYGDIPKSSWPEAFNLIQEAHAGFKVYKKLWFDAGFFKTHIGLGSFQPRENICSSMSIPDFYDPYYLSGAKLTYYLNSKFTLQVSMFNGYNEYIDHNSNKAFGFSSSYNPNKYLSFTYNFLTCDETPDNIPTKHQRYYQNLFGTYTQGKFTCGIDLNFGLQQNTLKADTTKMASMYSGSFTGKYQVLKKLGAYARVEDFQDSNDMLTGKLDVGKFIQGFTAGLEFKPQKTAALSVEWRILQSDKHIFKQGNYMLNQRNEFIVCLDLWF